MNAKATPILENEKKMKSHPRQLKTTKPMTTALVDTRDSDGPIEDPPNKGQLPGGNEPY